MKKKFVSILLSLIILTTSFMSCITAHAEYIGSVNNSKTAYDISVGGTQTISFINNNSEWENSDDVDLIDQGEGWLKFTIAKTGYYEVEILNPLINSSGYSNSYAYVKNAYGDILFSTTNNDVTHKERGAGKLTPGIYYIEVNCSLENDQKYDAQIKLCEHIHDYQIDRFSDDFTYYSCRICNYSFYKGTVNSPSKISIKTLSPAKKALVVKWTKPSSASGYQIQISTDKKFKNNKKVVTIKNSSTLSKKITRLKSKKKYFVKIRTYVTVNGSKKYSSWSSIKSVKTK